MDSSPKVMDNERRYLELSLLYMERRLTYIQLFEDIFNSAIAMNR